MISSSSSSAASSRPSSPKPSQQVHQYGSVPQPRGQRNTSQTKRQKKAALASPFVSRPSSPVDKLDDAHTSTQVSKYSEKKSGMGPPALPVTAATKSNRSGLVERRLEPNIQSQSRPPIPRRSYSVSVYMSPEKRKEGAVKSQKNDKKVLRELQRRPSAPSSLQRLVKVISKPFVPSKLGSKASPPRIGGDNPQETLNLHSNTEILPGQDLKSPPSLGLALQDDRDPLEWMNARSALDFNRPPSSMSVLFGLGRDIVEVDADDAVFTSSEEGSADEDDLDNKSPTSYHFQHHFGKFDLGMKGKDFAEGIPFASTPLKTIDTKALKEERETRDHYLEQVDEPQDMDLTFPLGGLDEGEGDETPWITDSLISIPTAYLTRQKRTLPRIAVGDFSEGNEDTEHTHKTQIAESPARLSSPFKLTYSDSTSSSTNDSLLDDTQFKSVLTADSTQKQNSLAPQRTRSGTITAPAPLIAARRTRTGTIIGPTPQVANSHADAQHVGSLASARRTRSGTIVGPLALPANRTSSGSMMRTSSLPVSDNTEKSLQKGDRNDSASECTPMASVSKLPSPLEEFDEHEGFADANYIPSLSSSPDPIDFLRFSRLIKEEQYFPLSNVVPTKDQGKTFLSSGDMREMVWCVADEPPSPEFPKSRGINKNGSCARGGGTSRKGVNQKEGKVFREKKGKNVLRFVLSDGRVDELDHLEMEYRGGQHDVVLDDELDIIG